MTRSVSTLIATVAAFCCLAAVAPASVSGPYRGTSSAGSMRFKISADGRYVVRFRFVNACPTDSRLGNLVPGRMRINAKGRFHHTDEQFTIRGRFTRDGARGTARNVTGDCDSGVLRWHATPVHD